MAEPEWDEETRALGLAHELLDLCPVCGGPAYLCQDPELQDHWKAQAPVRCHRQTALLVAQSKVSEQTNPQMHALLWRAELEDERGRQS